MPAVSEALTTFPKGTKKSLGKRRSLKTVGSRKAGREEKVRVGLLLRTLQLKRKVGRSPTVGK